MALRNRVIAGLAATALAANMVAHPGPSLAHASRSAQSLKAKITKMYPWAVPTLVPRTPDGKQFTLIIYEKGKPLDLGQAIGARLLNLYITELKGQFTYYLTVYSIAQRGAVNWQYIYTPGDGRLTRFHFISIRTTNTTVWYLTPKQIAQAAKVGHWPTPAQNH